MGDGGEKSRNDLRDGACRLYIETPAHESPSPRLRSVCAEAAHEVHERRELPRLRHLLGWHFFRPQFSMFHLSNDGF